MSPLRRSGALPALRVEMEEASGQAFQMYDASLFIKEAKTRLKWKVKDNTLKEVEDSAKAARSTYSFLLDALAQITPEVRAELARVRQMASTGVVAPAILGTLDPNAFSTMDPATPYALLTGLGSPTALLYGLNPGPPPRPGTAPTPPRAAPATEDPKEG